MRASRQAPGPSLARHRPLVKSPSSRDPLGSRVQRAHFSAWSFRDRNAGSLVREPWRFGEPDLAERAAGMTPSECADAGERAGRAALLRAEQPPFEPLPALGRLPDCAGQKRATRPAWAADERATARTLRPSLARHRP